jgi:hypothetical protein
MAVSSEIVCTKCGQTKTVIHSPSARPTVCDECKEKQDEAKKQKFINGAMSLLAEERERMILGALYDLMNAPKHFPHDMKF